MPGSSGNASDRLDINSRLDRDMKFSWFTILKSVFISAIKPSPIKQDGRFTKTLNMYLCAKKWISYEYRLIHISRRTMNKYSQLGHFDYSLCRKLKLVKTPPFYNFSFIRTYDPSRFLINSYCSFRSWTPRHLNY